MGNMDIYLLESQNAERGRCSNKESDHLLDAGLRCKERKYPQLTLFQPKAYKDPLVQIGNPTAHKYGKGRCTGKPLDPYLYAKSEQRFSK